ncbi:hypothetical protein PO909_012648 [Leuciscus waleckii]
MVKTSGRYLEDLMDLFEEVITLFLLSPLVQSSPESPVIPPSLPLPPPLTASSEALPLLVPFSPSASPTPCEDPPQSLKSLAQPTKEDPLAQPLNPSLHRGLSTHQLHLGSSLPWFHRKPSGIRLHRAPSSLRLLLGQTSTFGSV